MDCKGAKRLIPAYLDGELQADEATALSEHLSACQACREEMAGMERTVEAMSAFEEIQPAFTLADIRERAARRRPEPVFGWLWQMPRLAAAALTLAALAAGSVSGVYYSSRIASRTQRPPIVSAQRATNSFGLDAFDNGLSGAVYMVEAGASSQSEVTR